MILVTGGAGYIGVVLVEELLKRGLGVRVFDKLYFGEAPLAEIRHRIELVQGDIRDFSPSILDGVDAIIHLAALSNDPTAEFNPVANMEINAQGTINLAELCKQRGIKRFVYASSCSIYDKGLFAQAVVQDETSPVEPRAAYALSKYKGEQALVRLADDDFCPIILRQGTVYGFSPRMRYDLVVNTFVKDALLRGKLTVYCGGEMWRPLVDVRDAARAYICCLEAEEDKVRGEIFNIAYKNHRILEVAHLVKCGLEGIKDNIEIEIDYTEKKDRSYRVSAKKAETVLGFQAEISVEESARDMAWKIQRWGHLDFSHPRYYNIAWMRLLTEM